ncbi:DUF1127 domain-containing protein [uncultured Roseovarius sp.]|uniref:DUF1127 domain-containing protein n=1 Tax=uncultured Roseovarius sp. TaxID=293344 RepID=UPI002612129D|nr:DUF1127 domain-containing protein [uncultured Roseovarius sp.]
MTFLSHSSPIRRPAPTLGTSLRDVLSVYRQRRALAQLDDAALLDLGITREEAETESRRHFWDMPEN